MYHSRSLLSENDLWRSLLSEHDSWRSLLSEHDSWRSLLSENDLWRSLLSENDSWRSNCVEVNQNFDLIEFMVIKHRDREQNDGRGNLRRSSANCNTLDLP